MPIGIAWLIVTQNGLRNYGQVAKMAAFVRAGGKFTFDARLAQHILTDDPRPTPPPMHLAFMEDGRVLLHDGHHRAVAMLLAGRDHLDDSEYEFAEYTYHDYSRAHPEKGWFTPFDVDTEVRLPDFGAFRLMAKNFYEHGKPEELRQLMKARSWYAESRRLWTVKELTEEYLANTRTNRRRLTPPGVECRAAIS